MAGRGYLGELEQRVLWAVLRLDGEGYGTTILAELTDRLERRVTPGALYATLDRLEDKGMVASRLADAEPGRGGRRKRYLTVTAEGRAALERTRREWMRMWEGMDLRPDARER
jgi:DNA-binding PadR family transcriptional regulator